MTVQDYTEQSDTRFFRLNWKTWELLETIKEWEEWKSIKRKSVLWRFKKIYLKEKEFEWKKTEELHLQLDWGDTNYDIKCSLNSAFGRSMLNCLAGEIKLRELQNISVSIWGQQKDGGKMKYYLNVYNNDNKATWLYSIDEQKEMNEQITNSKWEYISTDYSVLNEKLRWEIENINNNNTIEDVSNDKEFWEEAKEENEDLEDLPF